MAVLHLVADHCHDNTELIGRALADEVHVRNEGLPGKAQALQWWLQQTESRAAPWQLVIVVDADSILAPDFISGVVRAWPEGLGVGQGRVVPLIVRNHPLARLAALSEMVELRLWETWRSRMGWPARLRGTGMIFRREVLESYLPQVATQVEDAELTLLLAAAGQHIASLEGAVVYDPKPVTAVHAVRQRARWLRGQMALVRHRPREILRLLGRGPRGWSVLASVLLKPRSLVYPAAALLAGLLQLAPTSSWGPALWAGRVVLASLAFGTLTLLVGVLTLPGRRQNLKTLLWTPLYLVAWALGACLALTSGGVWLRSRPPSPVAGLGPHVAESET